jgi:hypothetical protein
MLGALTSTGVRALARTCALQAFPRLRRQGCADGVQDTSRWRVVVYTIAFQ